MQNLPIEDLSQLVPVLAHCIDDGLLNAKEVIKIRQIVMNKVEEAFLLRVK